MAAYYISTRVIRPDLSVTATIHGPGIEVIGQSHTFSSKDDSDRFLEALNFGFAQGWSRRHGVNDRPMSKEASVS
jgi:hypothetical protein